MTGGSPHDKTKDKSENPLFHTKEKILRRNFEQPGYLLRANQEKIKTKRVPKGGTLLRRVWSYLDVLR